MEKSKVRIYTTIYTRKTIGTNPSRLGAKSVSAELSMETSKNIEKE